jgi:GTP-binding protein
MLPVGRLRPGRKLSRNPPELTAYDPALGERPEIVAVTKAELPGAAEVQRRLAENLGREVLMISSVTGQGLNTLIHAIARELEQRRSPAERVTSNTRNP